MTSELFLPTDAFVRSVGRHHSIPYSMLLGAGASVSSGVLSAEQCLWRWKRDILFQPTLALRVTSRNYRLPAFVSESKNGLTLKVAIPPWVTGTNTSTSLRRRIR